MINENYLQPDLPSKCSYGKNELFKNPHPKPIRNYVQKIYPDILHCIGNTPLVKLNRIPDSLGIKCNVLVKCEFLNPAGSVKDRIAYSMIEDAENRGLLKPGCVMIEPTSGNTGIGIALVGAVKGYQSIIVIPDKTASEKEDITLALGSKTVRVSDKIPPEQPGGIFSVPKEIQKSIPNSIILHQFYNPANPLVHYYGTAEEILEQCDGNIDMIAMGVGTGGTMTGIGRKFKEILPKCLLVGVDPSGSTIAEPASLNNTDIKQIEIEGIGHCYCPSTLDKGVADFWVKISDEKSIAMARRMHKEEGILCGMSSGTILCGALEAAKTLKEGQTCVVMLPDGVGNYLTKFGSDYWMEIKKFIPCANTFNHWWWDYKVSLLNPTIDASILKTATCQEAIDIIKRHGRTLLPVVDNNGNLEGVVTIMKLTKLLMKPSVNFDTTIERAINEKCATVTPNSNFGILSRILDNEGVAIIVEEKKEVLNQQKHKLLGVIFPDDFLEYIYKNSP